jgi:hypothetical protein
VGDEVARAVRAVNLEEGVIAQVVAAPKAIANSNSEKDGRGSKTGLFE